MTYPPRYWTLVVRRMTSEQRRAWLTLLRPPNLPTVPGDPLAGLCLAGGLPGWNVFALSAAALLLYIAGLLLNDVADIGIDRRERPERPLPSGRIPRGAALRAGLLCGLAGLAAASFLGPATLGLGTLLFLAILVYTFSTPRGSFRGFITMGLCRALSVGLGIAAAGAAATPPAAFLAAAGIGGYIAAVSWMAAGEAGEQTLDERRWLPLLLAAATLGGLVALSLDRPHLPVLLAIAGFAVVRIALLTRALGRLPALGKMPRAIGGYIRLLLLLQAACCAVLFEGLILAALLIFLLPVSAHLGRHFHAS
jgi:hypothetical protein